MTWITLEVMRPWGKRVVWVNLDYLTHADFAADGSSVTLFLPNRSGGDIIDINDKDQTTLLLRALREQNRVYSPEQLQAQSWDKNWGGGR